MFKITDVHTLGTEYTVVNKAGTVIDKIQIVTGDQILEAAIGEYDEEKHGSYEEYLTNSVKLLSNYDDIDPTKVLWYSSSDENIALYDVIEFAITNGYNKVILEELMELE